MTTWRRNLETVGRNPAVSPQGRAEERRRALLDLGDGEEACRVCGKLIPADDWYCDECDVKPEA